MFLLDMNHTTISSMRRLKYFVPNVVGDVDSLHVIRSMGIGTILHDEVLQDRIAKSGEPSSTQV
jgi:hypothetical protein